MEKAVAELNIILEEGPVELIVFQILDSTDFYARTEEVALLPARREPNSNIFHIEGELQVAPKDMFNPTLQDCQTCEEDSSVPAPALLAQQMLP